MLKLTTLFLFLLILWLLSSGHYTLLTVGLGVFSCVLIVLISQRIKNQVSVENNDVKITTGPMLFRYGAWLIWQIFRANIFVSILILKQIILKHSNTIHPKIVCVHTNQKSKLGRVILANSITLTPGTVSLRVNDDSVVVHTLDTKFEEELRDGVMDRRVNTLEVKR